MRRADPAVDVLIAPTRDDIEIGAPGALKKHRARLYIESDVHRLFFHSLGNPKFLKPEGHHRLTQQLDDPDLGLSAPFPITRASLRRKMVRDLTGRTAYQRRRLQLRDAFGPPAWPWRQRLGHAADRIGGGLLVNVVLFGALSAVGYWYLYVVLWLLPLATWYQLISRIRNIAEHAVVPDHDDPLRNTRTTLANFFERLLVAPYWVNYHLEHHLFMFVPCWRLPAAHRALIAAGLRERMEIQPGYAAVLRLATSRRDEAAPQRGPRGAQHI